MKPLYLLVFSLILTGCTTAIPASNTPSNDPPTATPAIEAATPTQPADTPTPQPMTNEGPADADVTFVKATQSGDGQWRFDVTVAHPDTGWQDYADGWDVVLPDGTVLKASIDDPFTRLLLHPHETEQPFTRSQSGLSIPDNITTVTVRAHDLVDGWGGQEITVDLTQTSGAGFEVVR